MIWNDYIAVKKAEWVGKAVIWNDKKYRVVDVDSNAALMIDLPSRFNRRPPSLRRTSRWFPESLRS